jgi:cell wall-associated NlpC family hydrolase
MKNALVVAALCILILKSGAFGAFSLCLGAYSKEDAEGLHKQLITQGYPVYLSYGENYEVRVGTFESQEKAEEFAQKIKERDKIDARVVEEEDLDTAQFCYKNENDQASLDERSIKDYSDPRSQKIVSCGLSLFGHPYKYGGTRIGKGIDCSFFVLSIYKELGIALPRTSGAQFKTGTEVDESELKVGDLVFFKKTYASRRRSKRKAYTRINHVGIYIGNGEFIHATRNVMRVTISRLDEKYFKEHFAGARRILIEETRNLQPN